MIKTCYEYREVNSPDLEKALSKATNFGKRGWRIIQYLEDVKIDNKPVFSFLMERKVVKCTHKRPEVSFAH